jgi:hypothetical protein
MGAAWVAMDAYSLLRTGKLFAPPLALANPAKE